MKILFTTVNLLFILLTHGMAQDYWPLSDQEPASGEEISIGWYPNPVNKGEEIKVEVILPFEADLKVELLDALGKKAFEMSSVYPAGNSRIKIFTQNLETGLYIIRVSTEGITKTEKIVIE